MKPIISVPVKYGAIAGVLGFILAIILYYVNRHPFLVPVHFDFRIVLFGVFLFFTLKEVRDHFQDGKMYFWQGGLASFIFILTYALVASLFIWIFAVLVPDFLTSYVKLYLEQMRDLPQDVIDKIGKDVYERNLAEVPSTNAFNMAQVYFQQSLVIGLFISIILSVLLRKQPKT